MHKKNKKYCTVNKAFWRVTNHVLKQCSERFTESYTDKTRLLFLGDNTIYKCNLNLLTLNCVTEKKKKRTIIVIIKFNT